MSAEEPRSKAPLLAAGSPERVHAAGGDGSAPAHLIVESAQLISWVELAERAEAHLAGPDQQVWLDRLEADHDMLRAALATSLGHGSGSSLAIRLAVALTPFWRVRGHLMEGYKWIEQALANAHEVPPHLRAKGAWALSLFAALLGKPTEARSLAEESLSIAQLGGDTSTCARSLCLLSSVHTGAIASRPRGVLALLDESIDLARSVEDTSCLVDALVASGHLLLLNGDTTAATSSYESCLTAARRAGDARGVIEGLSGLGWTAISDGDLEKAEKVLEEARELAETLGYPLGSAHALLLLADLARVRGDLEMRGDLLRRCLTLAREVQAPVPMARALGGLGRVALARGREEEALPLLEESVALARQAGARYVLFHSLRSLAQAIATHDDYVLAQECVKEALVLARELGDERAEASALFGLGHLANLQGDQARAAAFHDQALTLRSAMEEPEAVADSLEALAALCVDRDSVRAARLMGASHLLRCQDGGDRKGPSPTASRALEASLVRQRLASGAFEASRAEGGLLSPEEAVAHAGDGTAPGVSLCDPSGWDKLTPTERKVAQGVAQGLTNADIAERLAMAPSTVRTHLGHVYLKLGLGSRAELSEGLSPAG